MREGESIDDVNLQDYLSKVWASDIPDSSDMVDNPPHYNNGNIETIDAIESALGVEGFHAYCRGNALKYIWRSPFKGKQEEDIKKAIWYLKKLIGEG